MLCVRRNLSVGPSEWKCFDEIRAVRIGRRFPVGLLYDRVEPWPVDQLHGIKMDAVDLTGAEDGHDMRVVELAGRLGLTLETHHRGARGADVLTQDLYGHKPLQGALPRGVDGPHTAVPDLPAELVVA